MRTSLFVTAVALLCHGLIGCSSSSGAAPGNRGDGGSGTSAAKACADVSKARCQRNDACTNSVANKVKFGDEATCETRDTSSCTIALSAAGTGTTPDFLVACAAAVTAQSCADYLTGKTITACQTPAGKGALGSACAYPAQCDSTYCAVPKGAACGTCAAVPKAGDSCAAEDGCGPGFDCTKDTSICVVPAAQGGACGKGNPCAAGLSCVGATRLKQGSCMPAGQASAVCDPTEQTAPACDRSLGLYCDGATMKCAAAALVGPGDPCGIVPPGFAVCLGGASCEIPAGKTSGNCAAIIADGAPCDTAKGPGCLAPARCIVTGGATVGTCKTTDPTACK
jgi:hypothetical protein